MAYTSDRSKAVAVAKSIRLMIIHGQNNVTLTMLGRITNFATRYLPRISHWLLLANRNKIARQFTFIGGHKIAAKALSEAT